jgi:hypothetical protein
MPELAPVIKILFTIWKVVFAPREELRVAPALIPILTIAPMQECPVQRLLFARGALRFVGL